MKRRRLLLALGAALAVLVGVGGVWRLTARGQGGPHLDRVHFQQIKRGMPREEVEAIVGGPRGGDRGERLVVAIEYERPPAGMYVLLWSGRDALVVVVFSDDATVAGQQFVLHPRTALLERLTDALRRQLP